MIIDSRWWPRAAAKLPPTYDTTDGGVRVQADWTNTLVRIGEYTRTIKIAWRAYLPPAGNDTNRVILFIPGERLSGAIYDAAARWLAERGIVACTLTLAPNGVGHWNSSDPVVLEHLSIQRCLSYHVIPVIREMGKPDEQLVLAGDGLGGILAQLYAVEHPSLAGLILLGSCSPQRASEVWQASEVFYPDALKPPDLAEVRAWLDETATDGEAISLRCDLGPLASRIRQDYRDLARQIFKRPCCPVLLLAGECDQVIPRRILEETAADYGEALTLVPAAAHLLMLSKHSTVAEEFVEAFMQAIIT